MAVAARTKASIRIAGITVMRMGVFFVSFTLNGVSACVDLEVV